MVAWATFEAYRVVLNKLRDYTRRSTGRNKLEFERLTVRFVEGFRTYLVGHCGNSKNTVHKNLASVRTILYSAIREGRFPQEKNPFFQIRLEKGRGSKNKSIDIEDIWKIEDADLGDGRINDVRNCVLFAFYNAGMRVSDPLGRRVQVLVDEYRDAGLSEVLFDASLLPSGVYFYVLETAGFIRTNKMTLLK